MRDADASRKWVLHRSFVCMFVPFELVLVHVACERTCLDLSKQAGWLARAEKGGDGCDDDVACAMLVRRVGAERM